MTLTANYQSKMYESMIKCLNQAAIVSITDLKGTIKHVNSMFEEYSGYKYSEVVGMNHNFEKSGHHEKDFFDEMWETILSGKIWKGEILNKNRHGKEYWVDARIFPLFDENHLIEGFLSIRFDITDKVNKRESEMSQFRLKALGELTAQILHEITNPLSIIHGNIDYMNKHMKEGERIDEIELWDRIVKIENSSRRIGMICKNMQALMHGRYQHDIVNLVDEVIAAKEYLISKLRSKGIELKVRMLKNRSLHEISANSVQVQLVIINLVNHAINSIIENEDKWIWIDLDLIGETVILSITDSSLYSKEAHEKLYQTSFSSKDLFNETGIGLAVCKKIIESFGGMVRVDTLAKNFKVDIVFPRYIKLENK